MASPRLKKKISKPLRKVTRFNVSALKKEIRKEVERDYIPIFDLQSQIEDFLKTTSSLRNEEHNLISDLLDQIKEVKSNSVEEIEKQLDTIRLARKVISDNIQNEETKQIVFSKYDAAISTLENQLKKQNGVFATINRKFGKSSKNFLRGTIDTLSGGTPLLMKTFDLFFGDEEEKKKKQLQSEERINRIERLGRNLEYSVGSKKSSNAVDDFTPSRPTPVTPSDGKPSVDYMGEDDKEKSPSNAPEFPAKFKALLRGYEVATFEPKNNSPEPSKFGALNGTANFDDSNIVDAINRVDDRLNKYFRAKLLREDLMRDQAEARMNRSDLDPTSISGSRSVPTDSRSDNKDDKSSSIFEKLGQLALLLKGSSVARRGFGIARRALGGIRRAGSLGKVVGGGLLGGMKLGGIGKVLGSAGKVAKGIPVIGQVLMAVGGILDAFDGFTKADKFLLKKDPTFVDRGLTAISNIGGGFLSLLDDVLGWFGMKTNIGDTFTTVVSNGLVNLKDGISESFVALRDKIWNAISTYDTGALVTQILDFVKSKFGVNLAPAVDKAKQALATSKTVAVNASKNFVETKNKVLDPVKEILGMPTSKQIAATPATAQVSTPSRQPSTVNKPSIGSVGKSDYARLGEVSTKGETGGLGSKAISFGLAKAGDIGGVSYGIYQLTSQSYDPKTKTSKAGGTLGNFLSWMKNKPDYKPYAEALEKAGGAEAANQSRKSTDPFPNTWLKLSDDPKFKEAQHEFIGVTHYEPVKNFANSMGLNVDQRGMAVKQMLFAASVNTPGGTRNALKTSLAGKDVATMSDEDLITALQNERMNVDKYYKSSPESIKTSVQKRFEREKNELLTISKSESLKPVVNEGGTRMAVNSVDNRMAKLELDQQKAAPIINVPPPSRNTGSSGTTVIAPNAQPRNNESTYQRFQNKIYGM